MQSNAPVEVAGFNLAVSFDQAAANKALQRLGILAEDVPAKVFTKAVRKSMQPTLKLARSLVPIRTGSLARSLTVLVKKYPRSGVIFGVLGARKRWYTIDRKGHKVRPSKYIHLVEFGHSGKSDLSGAILSTKAKSKERLDGERAALATLQNSAEYRNYLARQGLDAKQIASMLRSQRTYLNRKARRVRLFHKIGDQAGLQAGRGFLRKSLNSTANTIINTFVDEVRKGVNQAAQGQKPQADVVAA